MKMATRHVKYQAVQVHENTTEIKNGVGKKIRVVE